MRRPWFWSLLLIVLCAAPAAAQIVGTPFEFSAGAGVFVPDARSRVQAGPQYNATLGYRWQPWLVTEGYGLWAPSQVDTFPGQGANFFTGGIDLRFNLRPAESRIVPFVNAGLGYASSHWIGAAPDKLERGAPDLGAGVLFNLGGRSRDYIRVQARDVLFVDRDRTESSHHLGASIGLHYVMGGKVKDSDLDGVRDWKDNCPETPIGAKVTAAGCPTDSDGDGVFDGIDKCPGTPKGAKIDKTGCPIDSDGDGVFDGLDQCADTPKGATVDAKGCPMDSDKDGVFDGLDQCADTPVGAKVDANGCPIDTDKDGVFDGLDQCPDTPAGLKVDAKGCPVEMMERETELLDTGIIRLNNINFDSGKAVLLAEDLPTLDTVGALLVKWGQLKIEIGGHTDNSGSAATNRKLSGARAQAVKDYLVQKYPGLQPTQYTVKGYGSSVPVASNKTAEGKAQNRRVEFKVLNKDVLKLEIEKRKMVPVEGAPADSTKH